MASIRAALLSLLMVGAAVAWAPPARASRADYYGGGVISNVEVVVVFWTGDVDPTLQSEIGAFLSAITSSPYIDWLEEYDTVGLDGPGMTPGSNQHIGRGSFSSAVTITPTNTSTSLLDADIQIELVNQINAGKLPAPTTDGSGHVNTLYMIEFPSGYITDVQGKTSCSNFCGYHFTVSYTGASGTDPPLDVPYAVMPDITACNGSCGSGFDEVTSIHSHELVEAITDTEIGLLPADANLGPPAAWYDPGDNMELADICDPFAPAPGVKGGTATVAGYTVQLIWSDYAAACVAMIPICNGTLTAPDCRPCRAIDDGIQCSGATPVCQTSLLAPNSGQCVGCLDDSSCAVPTPICNVTTNTCRACTASDCSGKTPLCATNGACVECEATNYSACTGATPTCDLTIGRCVGCQSSIDCSGATPVCNVSTYTCEACQNSTQCSQGSVCDTSSDSQKGQCVDCNTMSDCTFGTCETNTHTCFSPITDAGAPAHDASPKVQENPTATGSGCSCHTSPSGAQGSFSLESVLAGVALSLRRRKRRRART